MGNKKVIGLNSQQVLFLQGLLQSIKAGRQQQTKSFKIGVTEKYEKIKFDLEVYPNCKGFIAWRVLTTTGKGIFQTWTEPEEIENSFRAMSLL